MYDGLPRCFFHEEVVVESEAIPDFKNARIAMASGLAMLKLVQRQYAASAWIQAAQNDSVSLFLPPSPPPPPAPAQ
ncbi:MAG: hypothetical protein IPO19_11590 [Rhodoferax sp.]|nr:hypothetical protein [Rhodoferax sp.]